MKSDESAPLVLVDTGLLSVMRCDTRVAYLKELAMKRAEKLSTDGEARERDEKMLSSLKSGERRERVFSLFRFSKKNKKN